MGKGERGRCVGERGAARGTVKLRGAAWWSCKVSPASRRNGGAARRNGMVVLCEVELRCVGDDGPRVWSEKAKGFFRKMTTVTTFSGRREYDFTCMVPQRLYKLDELKLNGIDTSSFLSPVDQTLGSIERNLQIAALLGGLSVSFAFELSQLQALLTFVGLLFVWSVDLFLATIFDFPSLKRKTQLSKIYYNGGARNLVLDTIAHSLSEKYHNRVIEHEAGHFLIAYLLGVLPKEYTITCLDTLMKQGSLNVQAGTAFVDFEFVEEINTGKLSAKMLNKFSCIALAGVATEYLLYGYSEGGLDDVNKLDGLFKSLGFTQNKADSQVRWAVLNIVLILRRHEKARSKLKEAMSSGRSVGSCIEVIEENINPEDI
uniref:Peptidase M41 domain-containing protein n=1 Tax=Aegilops tauschii TaxID=37682 RepID=M8CJE3_AEGTA